MGDNHNCPTSHQTPIMPRSPNTATDTATAPLQVLLLLMLLSTGDLLFTGDSHNCASSSFISRPIYFRKVKIQFIKC